MSRKHYTRRKGLRQIYRTGARNRDRTSEDEHCGRHQHTAFAGAALSVATARASPLFCVICNA